MNLFVRHSIDVFNNRYIAGWFLHYFKKEQRITLKFVSGGRVIGEVTANLYRKDVELARVHPTGFCGFDFNFPPDVDLTLHKSLDIYIDGQQKPYMRLQTASLPKTVTHIIPPILFMHIPKTAGTSFNSFMRMHVPFDAALHHIENYSRLQYRQLAKEKKYLAGHLRIEVIKKYFDMAEFDCYTIVRNPYQHLHSHLNWLKGIAALKGSAFFQRHGRDVQQLAIKISELDFTDMSEVKKFVFGLQGFELDYFDNCQTRYFLDYRPEKVSLGDFKNTLNNVDLFNYIGITDRYERFRSVVSASYDLPEVTLPAAFNKTMHPRLYDCFCEDMKEIFYPLVHADLLLYDTIKTRFCNM